MKREDTYPPEMKDDLYKLVRWVDERQHARHLENEGRIGELEGSIEKLTTNVSQLTHSLAELVRAIASQATGDTLQTQRVGELTVTVSRLVAESEVRAMMKARSWGIGAGVAAIISAIIAHLDKILPLLLG